MGLASETDDDAENTPSITEYRGVPLVIAGTDFPGFAPSVVRAWESIAIGFRKAGVSREIARARMPLALRRPPAGCSAEVAAEHETWMACYGRLFDAILDAIDEGSVVVER